MDYNSNDIEKLSVKELEEIIPKLSSAYYNGSPMVSDAVFDHLVDTLKSKKPNSKILSQIGAPIREDIVKINLPMHMGSMDKIKPDTRELKIFLGNHTGPYFLSDKLDGDACLLQYTDEGVRVFTRGNGKIGQDISFIKDFLDLPNLRKNACVRGELNVSLKKFNKYFKHLKKPRTVISSVVNSKQPDPTVLKEIEFLAFEYIDGTDRKLSEQFEILKKLKFRVPEHTIKEKLTSDILVDYLRKRKNTSPFEIDGVIVTHNEAYPVNKSGNPKHAVAFKFNPLGIKTTVEEIIWDPSKHGLLFPRIRVTPVVIEGDTVSFISGKHAKFIQEKKIGPGTEIRAVKSGGVIPDVSEILKSTKESFPKVDYFWDETHVNIFLKNPLKNEEVLVKRILHFFTSLKIESIKIGSVNRLYQAGFTSPKSICLASESDFCEVQGYMKKSAKNLYDSIHKVIDKAVALEDLMLASMAFERGMGAKRFQILLGELPEIYALKKPSLEKILEINGFSEITAKQFLDGFDDFKVFLKEYSFLKFNKSKPKNKSQELAGQYVVFTGFRDKELEKKMEDQGAVIEKNITKKTTLVITNNIEEGSSKLLKAKEKGIPIKIIKK